MRLGIDAHPLREPLTGVGRYIYEILARFPGGMDIVLYSKSAPLLPPSFHDMPHKVRLYPSVPWAVSVQTAVVRDMATDKLDVFWAPNAVGPLLTKTPTVLTTHDLTFRICGNTMRLRRRILESLLVTRSLRRASSVLSVSNATADLVRQAYPEVARRVTVTQIDGASLPTAQRLVERRHFVLAVGTIEPRKNLIVLLDAIELLWANGTRVPLVIVGSLGWRSSRFRERLDRLSSRFPAAVEMRSFPDDAELVKLYRTCTAFIAASIYEGFGMPLVEAMREAAPVVASDIAAFREVGGNAPIFVDHSSSSAFAAAIAAIVGDEDAWRRRSHASLEQAKKFSWTETARQTFHILQKVGDITGQGSYGGLTTQCDPRDAIRYGPK